MPNLRNCLTLLLTSAALTACDEDPVSISSRASGVEPQANAVASPGDRAAILQIVETLDATWGIDAQTYASQYFGAEFVGPTGNILNRDEDILLLYQTIFPFFQNTTRQSIIRNLTFLTGTIAVLDIDTRVSGNLPPFVTPWQGNTVRALEKNILMKRRGEWSIVQHQQVSVAPGVGT
jgi:hypothetical protein